MSCLNSCPKEEFVKSILKYMYGNNSLATELKKIESYMKQGLSAEEISRKQVEAYMLSKECINILIKENRL